MEAVCTSSDEVSVLFRSSAPGQSLSSKFDYKHSLFKALVVFWCLGRWNGIPSTLRWSFQHCSD